VTKISSSRLLELYQRLFDHFGPQHWWPAETPLEVVLGAILTQNTNWSNVEKALANLQRAEALSIARLAALPDEVLQELIRPSGFFRQKAARIKRFVRHLEDCYQGVLARLLSQDVNRARNELLELNGIGPETADAILLYAGDRPSFVIDAYTVRLLQRLGLLDNNPGYEALRSTVMQALPVDVGLYNEFHALIVHTCKRYCRKRSPICRECPLLPDCPTGQKHVGAAQ